MVYHVQVEGLLGAVVAVQMVGEAEDQAAGNLFLTTLRAFLS